MLPPMIQTIKHFPDYQFIIAGAPNFTEQHYKNYFKGAAIEIRFGETYQLLSESTAALVTSGTATLETALLNVPQVVCYKAEKVSYQIAKRLVKIKFISLVNLIMDKEVVKELIQNDLNIEQIKKELSAILPGGTKRKEMLSDYEILQQKVGIGGASDRVAQGIMDYMSTQNAYEKS
jgi:lipid-A-disaccharide synthase